MKQVLKIIEGDRFPGQTSRLSHISHVIIIIIKKLTLAQMEILRGIVFSRFVGVRFVFCSGLVHYILLREVARCDHIQYKGNHCYIILEG